MGVGCLYMLPGIPVLYAGTELGGHGSGDSDQNVREALWGMPKAFDTNNAFFRAVQEISNVRAAQPALRYGRHYFRPISGDGVEFGISNVAPGIIAYSRILNDTELVILANPFNSASFSLFAIVDFALNPDNFHFQLLYSNKGSKATPPGACITKQAGTVTVHEADGSIGHGPLRAVPFTLAQNEFQVLGRK